MPTAVDNLFYKDIAKDLTSKYKPKPHQYFYAQTYSPPDDQNPFGGILPLTEEFFGPENLSLLILSRPYRTSPGSVTKAVERIKKTFHLWSKYKALVWVDMTLAQKMLDEGDAFFYDDMQTFEGKVKSFCEELVEYGVEYMGKLTEQKSASYFQTFIDQFYNDQVVA